MYTNTTGQYNAAYGANSLRTNNADANTAMGSSSMYSNTTGSGSVGIGTSALYANTTGANNVAIGYATLGANTTASNNTAVGYQAMYANTTGDACTAIGKGALSSNTTGYSHTAVGIQALTNVSTGIYNTGVGYLAGQAITTGTYNNILGSQDTTLTTGSYNIQIGRYANASASSVSYSLMINTDNTARTDKGSSTGFIFTGGSMYQGNNSASWATTSDQRLKKNIVDNNTGLDIISKIQVRNFEYRLPDEVDAELKPTDAVEKVGVQLGVIAQELAQVLPKCVTQESTGVFSVDTDPLIWYLVNAVKELKAEVDSLKQQLGK
jgi:hypothetical protein